jgi:acetoin utilization deacetylase AcuC-like enzyme
VHTAGDFYADAFERAVSPILSQFEPDWVLVSAGYDGHAQDPLADASLVEADYQMMGAAVRAAAPDRRLILFLEGGYNLRAMERSITATLAGIGGEEPTQIRGTSPKGAWRILDLLIEVQARYWKL